MFRELMPLLRNRAVLMTLTLIEDDKIRVTIVPKKLKEDENAALTTPVMITGTTEELEADLGKTLVSYTGSHLQLKNTLQTAQAEMDAAAKAARASATQAKSKVQLGKKDAPAATAPKGAEPVTAVASAKPERAKPASLFDMAAAEPAASIAPPIEAAENDEDDNLAEIEEDDDAEEEGLERGSLSSSDRRE